MKVVILPGKGDEGGAPTIKEIEQIENRYQLQSDGKSEYTNFDRAISIQRKIKNGMSLKDQLLDDPTHVGLTEKELNRKKVFPHNVLVFDEEHRLYLGNVVETAVDVSNKNHSAIFPIELPSWFIRLFTKENDVVLDPFLGSGTTAVAASLHGRKYIGIELKKQYFDDAKKNVDEVKKVLNLKNYKNAKIKSSINK